MTIRSIRELCLAVLAATAITTGATASSHGDTPTAVELSGAVTAVAEVVSVDRADRTIIVIGPRGNAFQIEAGEQVRNFDQIRVGDALRVTYHESVALYLGAPGSQPAADAAAVVARAPKGDKPAGMVAGAIDVSASVVRIDRKHREVTLELPDGNVVTHKVAPTAKAFDTLRVGDTIHARVTRAVAISVETP